jgi:hypothetical protein
MVEGVPDRREGDVLRRALQNTRKTGSTGEKFLHNGSRCIFDLQYEVARNTVRTLTLQPP